jgi:hypothetical protein
MMQYLNETLGGVKRFFQARRTFQNAPYFFIGL